MRKVYCENNGFVFANVEEAGKYFNIKVKQLVKHLEGKRRYAGKEQGVHLYWQYAEDDATLFDGNRVDVNWYNEYIKQ